MPDLDPRDPVAPSEAARLSGLAEVTPIAGRVLENEIEGARQQIGPLTNSPYRDVAKANLGVVCARHPGIAHGLQRVRPSAQSTGFVIKDPDRTGCLIDIDQSAERSRTKRETDVRA